jgi:hypothetical protein
LSMCSRSTCYRRRIGDVADAVLAKMRWSIGWRCWTYMDYLHELCDCCYGRSGKRPYDTLSQLHTLEGNISPIKHHRHSARISAASDLVCLVMLIATANCNWKHRLVWSVEIKCMQNVRTPQDNSTAPICKGK